MADFGVLQDVEEVERRKSGGESLQSLVVGQEGVEGETRGGGNKWRSAHSLVDPGLREGALCSASQILAIASSGDVRSGQPIPTLPGCESFSPPFQQINHRFDDAVVVN